MLGCVAVKKLLVLGSLVKWRHGEGQPREYFLRLLWENHHSMCYDGNSIKTFFFLMVHQGYSILLADRCGLCDISRKTTQRHLATEGWWLWKVQAIWRETLLSMKETSSQPHFLLWHHNVKPCLLCSILIGVHVKAMPSVFQYVPRDNVVPIKEALWKACTPYHGATPPKDGAAIQRYKLPSTPTSFPLTDLPISEWQKDNGFKRFKYSNPNWTPYFWPWPWSRTSRYMGW